MVPDWGASGHGEECEVGPGVHWCKINKIFVKEKKKLDYARSNCFQRESLYEVLTFLVCFWSINVFKSFWSFFLNLCQGLSFILTPFSLSCFICLTPDFFFSFFLTKLFRLLKGSRRVYEIEVRNQAEALEKQLRQGTFRDSLVRTLLQIRHSYWTVTVVTVIVLLSLLHVYIICVDVFSGE